MDPNTGRLYPSLQAAVDAGAKDAVEVRGTEEAAQRISAAVKAQRKAQRKAASKSRRINRKRAQG